MHLTPLPPFFSFPKATERRKASLEREHVLICLLLNVRLRSDAINSQNGEGGQGAELAENRGWRVTRLSNSSRDIIVLAVA